jgi:hypothetical protein
MSADLEQTKRKKKKRRSGDFEENPDDYEPLYCHCQQPSGGEMVACENSECPYEWFHFQCVGLEAAVCDI